MRHLILNGIDPVHERKQRRELTMTLAEVIESYKDQHIPFLKPTTQVDYLFRLNHFIKGNGSAKIRSRGFDRNLPIKEIKRPDVVQFLSPISMSSPTQALRLRAILSSVFRFAMDRGWIEENVVSSIRLPKRLNSGQK